MQYELEDGSIDKSAKRLKRFLELFVKIKSEEELFNLVKVPEVNRRKTP